MKRIKLEDYGCDNCRIDYNCGSCSHNEERKKEWEKKYGNHSNVSSKHDTNIGGMLFMD